MTDEPGTDLRYTHHARGRMAMRLISEGDVLAVISAPESTDITPDVVRYDRVVDGRPLRVIVKQDHEPLLVITAMVVAERVN